MRQTILTVAALCSCLLGVARAEERSIMVPGKTASSSGGWQPALLLRAQGPADAQRARHHVLYIHGATFPSSSSIMLEMDGVSWADNLNSAGFYVWALDFAGYGGSERYPEMSQASPPPGAPLGRAPEAANQIHRAVRTIMKETGARRVSLIAHSWGTIAAGLFAAQHPELVHRIVFFGPITRREGAKATRELGAWRFLTIQQQYDRFVKDVPAGHPAVLLDYNFAAWSRRYLESDSTSGQRSPPAVRTPNGPIADIAAAWSGDFPYDPALLKAPLAIIRGEWDSLCTDADATWLLDALRNASRKTDVRIAKGTHLMHLETSRFDLYQAARQFLAE